mmetsp:Transcript_17810/g.41670  ORF Transcript_17810/g.41670 Transcript_17810/m.41670 type:complete len:703 (+) Transcript_17810:62-2170(+)
MRLTTVLWSVLFLRQVQAFAVVHLVRREGTVGEATRCYDSIGCRRRSARMSTLGMVSMQDPMTQRGKESESLSILSDAKYPTQRGSTTDSRKIIATFGRQHLTAVRLRHILFATEELSQTALHQLRGGHILFEDLAGQLSACSETRDKGGEIGWVSVTKSATELDNNITVAMMGEDHLEPLLPSAARETVIQITTKPGDIISVESERGFHLVQVVDVMADVRKMSTLKQRSRKVVKGESGGSPTKLSGVLSGALQDDKADLTYKLETMGCQMNMADSERIEGQLQALGIRPFQPEDKKNKDKKGPDVVVLNTCSIRDHAEQKVYSYVGPYAKRKRDGDDIAIVVAGCVAQQEGKKLLRRAPEVDLVMGPQYANRIGDLLEDVSNGNQVVATEASHIMEDSTKPRRQSSVAAWVNVIYGCNERCSFCIVPTTRGVEQSRPVESILEEVKDLVSQGYKEITLLGQNIDAYGRDMIPKRKFSDLISAVGSTPGLERLRFVTSHPRYMSLGVVDAVAETPAACESFHIPFQSGSNEVLAAMGRGHTREKYLHIIDRIRSRIPGASITADVIVGFPGETEEQFQETLSLMDTVVFDSVNTAAYSPRPNTPAAIFENQIADDVKQDRLNRINELNKKHAAERRARLMGETVEILVEERNVRVPTQVMGRTRHGYIVYCEGDIDELRGKLVDVTIDTSHTYYLAGKRIN